MQAPVPPPVPGRVTSVSAGQGTDRSLTAEEYSQALKDYALVVEYQQLSMYAPSGVYVMPAVEDLRTWHGVAFLRQALYRGGIFKFTVTFPPQYPADGAYPLVRFGSEVFHPLVSPSDGGLMYAELLPNWNTREHNAAVLLQCVKHVFYMKDFADITRPANREAAELAADGKTFPQFISKVEDCVTKSQQLKLVNERDTSLRFTAPTAQHVIVREQVFGSAERPSSVPPPPAVVQGGVLSSTVSNEQASVVSGAGASVGGMASGGPASASSGATPSSAAATRPAGGFA